MARSLEAACQLWVDAGECDANPAFMAQSCARHCEEWAEKAAATTATTACSQWAEAGECGRNPTWMLTACGDACSGHAARHCTKWAADGLCATSAAFMAEHCGAACDWCIRWAVEEGCEERSSMRDFCDAACDLLSLLLLATMARALDASCQLWVDAGECAYDTVGVRGACSIQCTERAQSDCLRWAEAGECGRNPTWMLSSCGDACGRHAARHCSEWAADGLCTVVAVFMAAHCRAACQSLRARSRCSAQVISCPRSVQSSAPYPPCTLVCPICAPHHRWRVPPGVQRRLGELLAAAADTSRGSIPVGAPCGV